MQNGGELKFYSFESHRSPRTWAPTELQGFLESARCTTFHHLDSLYHLLHHLRLATQSFVCSLVKAEFLLYSTPLQIFRDMYEKFFRMIFHSFIVDPSALPPCPRTGKVSVPCRTFVMTPRRRRGDRHWNTSWAEGAAFIANVRQLFRWSASTGCGRINAQKFPLSLFVNLCRNNNGNPHVLFKNYILFLFIFWFFTWTASVHRRSKFSEISKIFWSRLR